MSQTDHRNNEPDFAVKPYDLHVFVCTNQKPEGKQSCQPKGAEEVLRQLKEWEKAYKERAQSGSSTGDPSPKNLPRIRVNKSGCLNFCSRGVAVAVYPKGDFCLQIEATETSVQKVVQRLEEHLRAHE